MLPPWLTSRQWMLREAYLLYQTFVMIFYDNHISWPRTFLMCYGVPAIIVAVSANLRWGDYGTATSCWLSTSHETIWAFIGPVLAVIAINIVVFIRIMYAVVRLSSVAKIRRSSRDDMDRFQKLKRGARASISFLCLLGITWVFGALAIGQAAVAFFYLFALCNSLQGAVIFIFHLAIDPK